MSKETLVGLETHIQLKTDSKLFCGCPTAVSEKPNSQTCEICLGHPGSKPMFNRRVLEFALKLCVALGCEIAPEIAFSRKTYFYPDNSKNYQITQYEIPLGGKGTIKLKSGKVVEIERIHIEEDPAALVHEGSIDESPSVLIDYNRSGIPLCEIVTTPCMNSPAEGREFLKELVRVVKYLDIFDEKNGVLKADLNVNLPGHPRVEIKNVSGFKDAEKAMNYELVRQKMVMKAGKKTVMHTRAWTGSKTIMLRTKESEQDYGYIIDADLPVFSITKEMIEDVRKQVPELAHVRAARYVSKLGLDDIDAEVMASDLVLAELFEEVSKKCDPVKAAHWMRKELLRVLHYNKKEISDLKFGVTEIVELLGMLDSSAISETTGQRLIEKMVEKKISPKKYVKNNNLEQVSDTKELEKICSEVVAGNEKAVEDLKSGNEKSFHFLVGQVMRVTKGKADPAVVNKIMKKVLGK